MVADAQAASEKIQELMRMKGVRAEIDATKLLLIVDNAVSDWDYPMP